MLNEDNNLFNTQHSKFKIKQDDSARIPFERCG